MCCVCTTKGITAMIDGDKIEKNENDYIVTKNGILKGVFDIGAVQFIYLTEKKVKNELR